ncbi:Sybindin-like family-domain-containing protein [Radiomyces spectabilis]|uniref:Sybindin-like family-domain-containing protein n=1 Tax=Radiomyces spectabilis TaxID=64574 RepID=UPI00221F1A0E|nr:Sybindin-like family-domain-containing protein [Radiomyces spectabilis]KAI8369471.1 Sybindin-like family-domain-containing protein [Radiomyces spectabilis]
MTIYNLYIFDRHCQCIYYQKWAHQAKTASGSTNNSASHASSSRLGPNASSSRFSTSPSSSSAGHSTPNSSTLTKSGDRVASNTNMTYQSGLAAGSVISIEEEAKLVYGVILSLRNFVRKLSGSQDGFISYKTSTYRLHYYETPTGLKFVMNSDPNTESLRLVLKQIYVQLYVEFVVKNGMMRFDDTRWEISQGFLHNLDEDHNEATLTNPAQTTLTSGNTTQPPAPGNISNELFRIAVDRFIRTLSVFE